MTSKIQKTFLGGIAGPTAMTMVIFIAPMMGMPKMNPPEMLADMLHVPVAIGWAMHFMIGIIFSAAYAYAFIGRVLREKPQILKGTVFGIMAFVFAQIMMAILGAMMPMP